jgi:O-antigen/teichoic acid export membrane protein
MAETTTGRLTFFRQTGWMVLATGLMGLFMTATQMVAARWMEPGEYAVWFALLRVYLLLGIPSIGLQTVFAHQAAASLDPASQERLHATVRAVLRVTFLLWLAVAVATFLAHGWLLRTLKIANPAALWITLAIGLVSLWAPVIRGLVQGHQRFAVLGWALILDGVGRFTAVLLIVLAGGQAAGGMAGALLGQVLAVVLCLRVVWSDLSGPGAGFDWGPWLRQVGPITAATGTVLFLSTADVVYVQSLFPLEQSQRYVPAAMIGLALTTFGVPIAAVMFPKVARSTALARGSKAMPLALAATLGGGALAALACTAFPEVPLRLIFFGKPLYWQAAPLVPWFAWVLLPLIVANVLINNLLAAGRFRVVPWVLAAGLLYLGLLFGGRHWLPTLEPFTAFRVLLGTLGACNLLLLTFATIFTLREPALPLDGKSAVDASARTAAPCVP